jgi:hypothetical protein
MVASRSSSGASGRDALRRVLDSRPKAKVKLGPTGASRRHSPIVARLRKAYVATARQAVTTMAVEARRSLRRRPGTQCPEKRTLYRSRPGGYGMIGRAANAG